MMFVLVEPQIRVPLLIRTKWFVLYEVQDKTKVQLEKTCWYWLLGHMYVSLIMRLRGFRRMDPKLPFKDMSFTER